MRVQPRPALVALLDLPPLIELAEAVLGRDCHVIGQTAWRSHPGYPGMGLHLDYLPMTFDQRGKCLSTFCLIGQ